MKFTSQKDITVYARDGAEAEEKAVDVVLKWANVDDAEAVDCCEDNP